MPKAKGKTSNQQNLSVSITKDLDIYVNKERVLPNNLESFIKSELSGVEEPTIILRAEEGVPIEEYLGK